MKAKNIIALVTLLLLWRDTMNPGSSDERKYLIWGLVAVSEGEHHGGEHGGR